MTVGTTSPVNQNSLIWKRALPTPTDIIMRVIQNLGCAWPNLLTVSMKKRTDRQKSAQPDQQNMELTVTETDVLLDGQKKTGQPNRRRKKPLRAKKRPKSQLYLFMIDRQNFMFLRYECLSAPMMMSINLRCFSSNRVYHLMMLFYFLYGVAQLMMSIHLWCLALYCVYHLMPLYVIYGVFQHDVYQHLLWQIYFWCLSLSCMMSINNSTAGMMCLIAGSTFYEALFI